MRRAVIPLAARQKQGKTKKYILGKKERTSKKTSSQCGKRVAEEPRLAFGELDGRHSQTLLITLVFFPFVLT